MGPIDFMTAKKEPVQMVCSKERAIIFHFWKKTVAYWV